jgi:16S rRNA (guanine966-N2)-methyltransferase
MRIIAGEKRGMKLFSPKTDVSRPITDRVKESLFNVLYNYDLPNGKIVVDLFCGVGSLGLEALSRGAEFVIFVEQDPKVTEVLEKNIEKAGFVKESKIIRANAFKIGAPSDERRYDLIFVDPPYACTKNVGQDSPLGKLLISISQQLNPDGIVIVRTERRTELLNQYGLSEIIERRQWGTMAVTILKKLKV